MNSAEGDEDVTNKCLSRCFWKKVKENGALFSAQGCIGIAGDKDGKNGTVMCWVSSVVVIVLSLVSISFCLSLYPCCDEAGLIKSGSEVKSRVSSVLCRGVSV